MRKLILIILPIIYLSSLSAKTLTDMVGRSIEVPDELGRILPYDVKTSILLFPVANEKMVAKPLLPGSKTHQYISDKYNTMPEVDMKNIESVIACNPQIIIAGSYNSENGYERFEKLQERIHIPVVIIDLSIDKLDQTYYFLSNLLGNEKECSACAFFLQKTYSNTETLVSENPNPEVNVYYTVGGSGLMTDPAGSKHTEVLDYFKLNNVAKVAIPTGGHAKVNMEQVLLWNPDYIFAAGFKGDKNAYTTITSNPKWNTVSAVKSGNVYKVPSQPFGWFDHPPTVNRIPGIIWLSQVFFSLQKDEAEKQIVEFYKLFYKYELSPTEYQLLFE